MAKLEDIQEMWKQDAVIDNTEPGRALLEIPKLHSKYLNILSKHKMQVRSLEIELNKMRRLKYAYYAGRMGEMELAAVGWEPFPFILKADIAIYMEGDPDLNDLLSRKAINEEVVDACTSIMKELQSRTWQLRSYIDYQKFIHGGT